MAMEVSSTSESAQLQIRFLTKQQQYSVPDTTFAVPASVKTKELNTLVNQLLSESINDGKAQAEFDFLALGEFIRSELGEHVSSRGGSSESVIDIEYVERLPAPEPKDCLLHDDWVSAVHVAGKWILTGCYDSTLHMWTTKGKHKLTIPGHTECVKAVSWVSLDETNAKFISGSHDQTVLLWEWNVQENVVDCVHVCKGHSRGIECVSVSHDKKQFASGGWDNMLKIWSTDLNVNDEDNGESEAKRSKKSKKGKPSQIRSPVVTLAGHREAVSGLCWEMNGTNLVSCSWDHTLRLWDVAAVSCVREVPANKALFDVHSNPFNNLLIVASADRHVRLFDPRSTEGLVVKGTYTSHSQWVQTVKWSPTHESLFISGGYDNQLKLWDTRSPKVPLYDMSGHEDKILCCDWSDPALMVSGGADNTVRVFKSKNHPMTESTTD